jgi:hypothetical protein
MSVVSCGDAQGRASRQPANRLEAARQFLNRIAFLEESK